MTDLNVPHRRSREVSAFATILSLTGFLLVGMAVGGVLSLVIALQAGGGLAGLNELLQNPSNVPGGWWLLMAVQAVSHVCTYLLPALLCWQLIEHRTFANFSPIAASNVSGSVWLIVPLLVIAFMPLNGLIIEWNQNVHLPDTLKPIEDWMRDKENAAARLTKFLTSFSSVPQLTVALFVIAVVASVGEEVLFRGLLQRKLTSWTGNVHLGIWLAAALFSAIHLQFLGFFPRMLLGALFGYLFVWSGNLWVPILAHFVNNGFMVLMLYLHENKHIGYDIEATDSVPLPLALASLVASVGLLVWFRKESGHEPFVSLTKPPRTNDE